VRCTRSLGCGRTALWRISVPADPWPLQYACPAHLVDVVSALGGDVRVRRLEPGQPTPQPRAPEDVPAKLRAVEAPPDDTFIPLTGPALEHAAPVDVLTLVTCPSENTTASSPRVTVTCQWADSRKGHRQGIHLRDLGDRIIRWPVTDFDLKRWRDRGDQ
jgi:hypothetical protein